MKKIVIALLCISIMSSIGAKEGHLLDDKLPQTARYSEQILLKNWALSRCIGQAFGNQQTQQDAYNSASGYLEYGHAPIEAYDDIGKLITAFLAKKYAGSIPGTFHTMECIDLFHSKALADVVNKYSRAKAKAKRQ